MEKEVWKCVTGYEGIYEVSNLGRVRSLERIVRKWDGVRTSKGKILSPATNLHGYLFVQLYKNGRCEMKTIHRIVATAFIPNTDNLPQINHKDENKKNNRASNLEWCTAKYNNNYGCRTEMARRKMERGLVAYDLSGNLIGRFSNFTSASNALGISKAAICKHAKLGTPSGNGIMFYYK